jgi:ureidoglycolate lyase
MRPLQPRPLTAAAMAPFGSLIEPAASGAAVNGGTSIRHEAVPSLNLQHEGGRAVLAVYAARARALPLQARVLERHRLSDQVFLPLGGARRCVLLLAPAAIEKPRAEDCVALLSDGHQGICIAAGTWHHGLLALDDGPWAVLERRAAALDCDEATLDMPVLLAL